MKTLSAEVARRAYSFGTLRAEILDQVHEIVTEVNASCDYTNDDIRRAIETVGLSMPTDEQQIDQWCGVWRGRISRAIGKLGEVSRCQTIAYAVAAHVVELVRQKRRRVFPTRRSSEPRMVLSFR